MGEENIEPTKITLNTTIEFTIKSFIATIFTILSIFASFYFMVIDPRISSAEINAEKMLETKINDLKEDISDLRKIVEDSKTDKENINNNLNKLIDATINNTRNSSAYQNTENNGSASAGEGDSDLH